MAVMVRAAGVPARVALGYTPGQVQRDGSRLITTDDAHAWVEVYFQGSAGCPSTPRRSRPTRAVDLPWAPRADADTGTDAAAGQPPSPRHPPAAAPTARQDRADDAAATAQPGQGAGGPSLAAARPGRRLVLVLLVVAAPAGVRVLQRRRRLAAGTAGGAVGRADGHRAATSGVRLQPAWTPRQAAQELAR